MRVDGGIITPQTQNDTYIGKNPILILYGLKEENFSFITEAVRNFLKMWLLASLVNYEKHMDLLGTCLNEFQPLRAKQS